MFEIKSELELTNEDKLIILCTKGHYRKYENPIQFLIAEIYDLELQHVNKHKEERYLMKIYSKLVTAGYIKLGENPVYEVLKQVSDIGIRPLAPTSLYEMFYGSIANVVAEGLGLDEVDDTVMVNCELKDNDDNKVDLITHITNDEFSKMIEKSKNEIK